MALPKVFAVVKLINEVLVPLQKTWLAGRSTCAFGFTVIVNVVGVPLQVTPALVYVGVTIIIAIIGCVPSLIAVKEILFPELFTNPILGAELVQE